MFMTQSFRRTKGSVPIFLVYTKKRDASFACAHAQERAGASFPHETPEHRSRYAGGGSLLAVQEGSVFVPLDPFAAEQEKRESDTTTLGTLASRHIFLLISVFLCSH